MKTVYKGLDYGELQCLYLDIEKALGEVCRWKLHKELHLHGFLGGAGPCLKVV